MAQQNYFQICIQQNFKSLSRIVLSVYLYLASDNLSFYNYNLDVEFLKMRISKAIVTILDSKN